MESCTEWDKARFRSGYGAIWSQGRMQRAHRVVYEEAYGSIPSGKSVLHHCDNPPCVRPEHLFLGTQLDNIRDMDAKERRVYVNPHAEKTHCPKGHPYSGENLYVAKDGSRACRMCKRASFQRWYAKKRGV